MTAATPHNTLIPWCRRRDVVACAVESEGEAAWTLKDPLSLAYFRMRSAEYAVWNCLDGRITVRELLTELGRRFPREPWSAENLLTFLSSLAQAGLVTLSQPGQSRQIFRRLESQPARRWLQRLGGLLAFRWRGIDPEPLLRRTEAWTSWLFHPISVTAGCGLIATAGLLVLLRWETLIQRLPDSQAMLGVANWLPLVVVFVLIKLLHELGHVLTCRRFGGECHELGVQVLLFMPLFYGDVTDAWMLSRRWPRIAISAAGIFVELSLAAIATWLWWWSVPGWLNSVFLNAMLVCSVNTLLFNGNPLLRYDGYYVLSDLWNRPNLAAQGQHAVLTLGERLVLGVSDDEPQWHSPEWWCLFAYGVASSVYRWLVLIGIVWFLSGMFEPLGLGVVARTLSILVVGSAVVMPILNLATRCRMRWTHGLLRRGRSLIGGGCLMLLIAAVMLVPWPHSVRAPCVLHPADGVPMFVSAGGRIERAAAPGQKVAVGDLLLELSNPDLQLRRERQSAEVAKLTIRLKNLETQRANRDLASQQIPATRDALASAQQRLKQLDDDLQRLRIVSPVAGTVLPPPNQPRTRPSGPTLTAWQGTPLDASNHGATLAEQTLVCVIGDPTKLDVLLYVDQQAIEFLRVGQAVRLQLSSDPANTLKAEVVELAAIRTASAPRELIASHAIAAQPSPSGPIPIEVLYEVRARLRESAAAASFYSPGQAQIACGTLPLWSRAWRSLRNTFSADL